jgi:hypothetical protein
MSARQTSIEAYHSIKNSGVLGERRTQVYVHLYKNGPCTAQEIFKGIGCDTNQSGRLTEMRDLGVVEEIGERECSITGHRVILWDVTSSLPKKSAPKRTKIQLAQDEADRLRGLLVRVYAVVNKNSDLAVEIAGELGLPLPKKKTLLERIQEKREEREGVV